MLDLNATVAAMITMLRRLIGENIELRWQPGADLWPVRMDASQIDQMLANLCVNARDAISGIGHLTIQTGNRTIDDARGATAGVCPWRLRAAGRAGRWLRHGRRDAVASV